MDAKEHDKGAEKAYVLITPAYNEEEYIEQTILSILAQRRRPLRWVIVSDASTDQTDKIIMEYESKHSFIQFIRQEEVHYHNFAAKANAIKSASTLLNGMQYEFIGILDADVSLVPDYYSTLIQNFNGNPKLGLTGGFIYEKNNGNFKSRKLNRIWSVAGAAQFFRRECFEAVGGIRPLKYGGEDWYAEVSARMLGWTVTARPDLQVFHHRSTGKASGWIRGALRQGRMDHAMGTHPAVELLKLLRRVRSRPFLVSAATRFAGFVLGYCSSEKRVVSPEFVKFLRAKDIEKIRKVIPNLRRSASRVIHSPDATCE